MNPMETARHIDVELPLPRALNEPIGLGYMAKPHGGKASPWADITAFLDGADADWAGWGTRLIEIGAHLHRMRFAALQAPDCETDFPTVPDERCLVAKTRALLAGLGGPRAEALVDEARQRLSDDAVEELGLFLGLQLRERGSILAAVDTALAIAVGQPSCSTA